MQLRIRVGASADRSLSTAFQPAVDQARKAAAAISAVGAKQARSYASDTRKGANAAEREYAKLAREADRWQKKMVRDTERSLADKVRAEQRAAAQAIRIEERTQRERSRIAARESRNAARESAKAQRDEARRAAANDHTTSAMHRGAMRMGGRALGTTARAGMAAGRFGAGIARDLAAGAGVDLSAASVLAKNTDLETAATNLSNSGYMAGDARNGSRVDPRTLMKQAFGVGKATGTDANEVLGGLERFTGKTGDLATGRDVLKDMAVLAKATGAGLDDMVDAAGDVANALGDTENKGAKITQLMKTFAGQGKLGAVEVKNLATQMAKLGAAAGTFEGGEKAIAQMGVLAQMSRAKGGSASATQAATSVGSFTNIFSKGARLDAFKSFGVDVHGAGGKVRNPKDLMIDMLRAASSSSHGGMGALDRNMGKMVSDAAARRSTRGFENVYKEAGGGEAGIRAVTDAFNQLEKAAIADKEVAESFARAMDTSKSKAEVFNNQLREIAADAQKQLMPALMALTPAALNAATALANVAVWTADKLGLGGPKNEVAAAKGNAVRQEIDHTEKQLAGGKISAAQEKRNNELTEQMRADYEKSKGDLDSKKEHERTTRGAAMMLNAFDYTPLGYGISKLGGGSYGDGIGHAANQKEKNEIGAAQLKTDVAKEGLDKMISLNERLLHAIETGIAVRVKEVPQGKGAPLGVDMSGTSNTAETE